MANKNNLLIASAVVMVTLMFLSSCANTAQEAPAPADTAAQAPPPAAPSDAVAQAPAADQSQDQSAPVAAPSDQQSTPAAQPAVGEPKADGPVEAKPSGTGRFKLTYAGAKDEYHKQIEDFFKEAQYLTNFTDAMSEMVSLPQDVPVILKECGKADAKYDKETKKITYCYELAGHFSDIVSSENSGVPDEQIGQAVMDTTSHILLHEMSRAVMDLNKIPSGSDAEKTADKISSLIMMYAGPEGQDLAVTSSSVFFIDGMLDDSSKVPYWTGHTADPQRFLDMICWIYGSDPDHNVDLVDEGYIPQDQAQSCIDEFDAIVESQGKAIEPFLK